MGPRYIQLRYLGEGAYGVVAEALDTSKYGVMAMMIMIMMIVIITMMRIMMLMMTRWPMVW